MAAERCGTLYVCGTPIGNLADVSARLAEVLKSVAVVAAEDTRRTRQLLQHLGAHPLLLSCHAHNERTRAESLCQRLLAGEDVALVSDAGMPGISDPGAAVVAAAHEVGAPVRVVPGPSAVVCALAVSGFDASRFCFEGFLPPRGALRRARIAALAEESRTVVLYEAPHRLLRLLQELASAMPNRLCLLARELTKRHEEVMRAPLAELAQHWAGREVKGEIVLVLAPLAPPSAEAAMPADVSDAELASAVEAQLRSGLERREALRVVAQRFGVPRRRVYDATLRPGAPQGRQEEPAPQRNT